MHFQGVSIGKATFFGFHLRDVVLGDGRQVHRNLIIVLFSQILCSATGVFQSVLLYHQLENWMKNFGLKFSAMA